MGNVKFRFKNVGSRLTVKTEHDIEHIKLFIDKICNVAEQHIYQFDYHVEVEYGTIVTLDMDGDIERIDANRRHNTFGIYKTTILNWKPKQDEDDLAEDVEFSRVHEINLCWKSYSQELVIGIDSIKEEADMSKAISSYKDISSSRIVIPTSGLCNRQNRVILLKVMKLYKKIRNFRDEIIVNLEKDNAYKSLYACFPSMLDDILLGDQSSEK